MHCTSLPPELCSSIVEFVLSDKSVLHLKLRFMLSSISSFGCTTLNLNWPPDLKISFFVSSGLMLFSISCLGRLKSAQLSKSHHSDLAQCHASRHRLSICA